MFVVGLISTVIATNVSTRSLMDIKTFASAARSSGSKNGSGGSSGPDPSEPDNAAENIDQLVCSSSSRSRIVGGNSTNIKAHPWIVSIQTNNLYHFCGGSILNSYTILTAAHCITDISNPDQIRVVFGLTDKSEPDESNIREVHEILKNPSYNGTTYDGDVAILILKSRLELSAGAKATCVIPGDWTDGSSLIASKSDISGWGVKKHDPESTDPGVDVLRTAEINTPNKNTCTSSQYESSSITDKMICSGNGTQDSCQGDSGGGVVFIDASGYNRLIGIVSWGHQCGLEEYPGVYTDLREASIRSFISAGLKKSLQYKESLTN